MAKAAGPKLFSSQFGGEIPIPPEFLAAMDRKEEIQAVPNETDPEALSDEIVESKVVTNRTNERVRHTVKKKPGNITLRDIHTDNDGLPVQVTRVLYPTGSQPDVPTATTKVAVKDLGNGWSIQESGVQGSFDDDGNFIPGIFVGPKYEVAIPDTVPDRFKVAIPVTTTDLSVEGQAAVPVLGPGDLDKFEEQTDDFIKRTHVATRATIPVPQTLTGKDTNDDKQVVSVIETYKNEGGDAVPTALKDVEVQPLGGGRVLQIERTIPAVFTRPQFVAALADTTPAEFLSFIPTKTTTVDAAGIATMPILGPFDLRKTVSQIDAFRTRTETLSRPDEVFPISLVGTETTPKKQVAFVTKTLRADNDPDPTPTALQDVTIENLGGFWLQTIKAVGSVFADAEYVSEIEDTVPTEFRALIPHRTTATTVAGTAAPPTLLTGELRKRVTQVDAFKKRTEIVDRNALALPVTFNDKYFGGVSDGRGSVFSGNVTKARTLDDVQQTLDQSFLQFDSKVKNIGAGQSVKETDSLPSYPTLSESVTDETGVVIDRTKSLVAAGTALPAGNYSQYALDSQRTLRVLENVDTVSIDTINLRRIFTGEVDVQLPPQLLSVTIRPNATALDATYVPNTPVYQLGGNFSGGVDIHGRVQAGASVILDVDYATKRPWGQDVLCTHYLFYLPWSTVESTGVLASVNAIRGSKGQPLALSWPLFSPKEVIVVCKGGRITCESSGEAHAHDVIRQDYNGVRTAGALIRTGGKSQSFDAELVTRTTIIPPTIHGAITVALEQGAPGLTQSVVASGTINTGQNQVVLLASGSVTAEFTPASVPATPGTPTIPTSGVYLYRRFVEPYKYGVAQVHAIVVDFANIL